MALSGLVMVGFLVGHLGGNLFIFLGKDALNNYAAKLHSMGGLLWLVRLGLLGSLLVHITTAIVLTRRNRQSRMQNYAVASALGSSLASRSMALTGSLLGLYICFHLAHFTLKLTHPEFAQDPSDVYSMIVLSFQHPGLAGLYVLAMLLMGMHLYHGVQSAVASLGLYHPLYTKWVRAGAIALSTTLVVGFSSIPIAVLFGLIT